MTLDVYAHLFADGLREAADRFDPLARQQVAEFPAGTASWLVDENYGEPA